MDFSLLFPFEGCQLARTRYEFLEFPYRREFKKPCRLPLARFAHGVLICRLVGFTNSFYRGAKKSRSCTAFRGRWSVIAGGRRIRLLRLFP